MRPTIVILAIFILCSCKNKQNEIIQIRNEFKLEFLNEILSDTTELKILLSKKQPISNYGSGYMVSAHQFNHYPPNKSISYNKFISDTLHIDDTAFVKSQRELNRKLDLNLLENYGFVIFDLKGMVESGISYKEILDISDSLNLGTNNYEFLKFSVPIFNKEKNLAYLVLEQGMGGESMILEKVEGKWRKKYEFNAWIE